MIIKAPHGMFGYPCADKCEDCIHVVRFSEVGYCGFRPQGCGLHECIKGLAVSSNDRWRRCVFCNAYEENLNSERCAKCLATENLCNFTMGAWAKR